EKEPGRRSVPAAPSAEKPESKTTESTTSGSEESATAAGSAPETISDEDRADLERLFGEFGRLDNTAGEPTAASRPAAGRDSESP
ncbi:MAG TPA: hypothetical protein VLS27_11445, partial [Gammaproteobacteria bacterium]|nr:hypothetical protein [Gammaproteobacteria bacterium]